MFTMRADLAARSDRECDFGRKQLHKISGQ
jgi:hypothetical protein